MKILMLLESEFPPDVRVENEMSALSSAGHEVHLACSTRKDLPVLDRWNNSVIQRKPMSAFIYKSSIGSLKFPFYFSFWRKFIFALLKKESFDAIHIHDLPLSKIGVEAKKVFNIHLIIDLHENWPALLKYAHHTQTFFGRLFSSDRQWKNYEKLMLQEADLVVTIIEEAKERIISLGIDKDKICLVSNTTDIENIRIPVRKRTDDDFIIFYGGGINRHRGLQVVLDAIRKLKDKSIINLKSRLRGWTLNLRFIFTVINHSMKCLKLLQSLMQQLSRTSELRIMMLQVLISYTSICTSKNL
jgi:glycosyltransferase involved in cell wall biosynthesis